MNCHRARMALVERELGSLTLGFERALDDHLLNCTDCRESSEKELGIVGDLAALRSLPLPEIDIANVVALRVRELPRIERSSVPIRDVAWAAGAAVAAALGLLAWISPQTAWLKRAAGLATDGVAAILSASYSTLGALKVLLVLPWRLASVLVEAVKPLLDGVARLEPVAIATVSVGLVLMMLTIVWVVGNDLRRPTGAASRRVE